MNQVPLEEIADSMVRMRSSLARVELAASRLARASRKPATRQLAEGVSESVREIDEEIDRNLRMLRPDPAIGNEIASCSEILLQIEERMAPILGAHAIEWVEVTESHASIRHDRVAFERAALVLLRAGISMAGPGGSLALGLCSDEDESSVGLRLETQRSVPPQGDAVTAADVFSGLRAYAQRCGSAIEVDTANEDEALVTLWLTSAEDAS